MTRHICNYLDAAEGLSRIYPVRQVAYKGSTVLISCISIAKPKWTFENFPLENYEIHKQAMRDNQNEKKYTVILHNVTEKNSGEYTCHGKYIHTYFQKSISRSRNASFKGASILSVGG